MAYESQHVTHSQNKSLTAEQLGPISRALVSVSPSSSFGGSNHFHQSASDCKPHSETGDFQSSPVQSPQRSSVLDGYCKPSDPPLLDERSLLGCFVQAIPAEASARIKISTTLPNRLGKMLAPLYWHDYKKQYGRLDEFVASHRELFIIEGDANLAYASESIKFAAFTTEILEGFDAQRTWDLADTYGVPLKVVSYKSLYGWTMDEIVKEIGLKNNCTFCGVFRRQALDRGATMVEADKIATGHNADDIAETVLLNILRGDIAKLGRCTQITTGEDGSIPRCKPFKYTYEKEIVMYAYFKKLDYFSTECIYSPNVYRGFARDFIKDLE